MSESVFNFNENKGGVLDEVNVRSKIWKVTIPRLLASQLMLYIYYFDLYYQKELFYCYVLKEEQVSFKINLNVFMECLGIFGSTLTGQSKTPSLMMYYDGYGEPLVLTIEEGMRHDYLYDCNTRIWGFNELDLVTECSGLGVSNLESIVQTWMCIEILYSVTPKSGLLLAIPTGICLINPWTELKRNVQKALQNCLMVYFTWMLVLKPSSNLCFSQI